MNFIIFILSCVSNAISVACGGVLSDKQLTLAGHGAVAMLLTILPVFFRIKATWSQGYIDTAKDPVLWIQIACCAVAAIIYFAIVYCFFINSTGDGSMC